MVDTGWAQSEIHVGNANSSNDRDENVDPTKHICCHSPRGSPSFCTDESNHVDNYTKCNHWAGETADFCNVPCDLPADDSRDHIDLGHINQKKQNVDEDGEKPGDGRNQLQTFELPLQLK